MNISPKTKDAYKLIHQSSLAFARAERQGMRVDVEYIDTKQAHLTRRIDRIEGKFKETKLYRHWEHTVKKAPNIYSDDQLATYLYKVKKIHPTKQTTAGRGSTDVETLQELGIPELDLLIQGKKLKKIRDTYLEGFKREQVKGYMHPFFNLHLARTHRSSSNNPNFQNVPKRDPEAMQITRQALYPRPGRQLLEVDYSGLEVKIAAAYHKDPMMLKYLNDPTTDMHADMAAQLFCIDDFDQDIKEHSYLRSATKNGFVFPEFYGDYYKNCAVSLACKWGEMPHGKWKPTSGVNAYPDSPLGQHLISKGIKSIDDFIEHVKAIEKDFWENRFPDYAEWKERWWKVYQKHGYINMYTGFTCSGVMGKNDCINYPVQGAAFHCLLWSFVEMDRIIIEEKWDTKILGQIHDAIVLDVHPNELDMVLKVVQRVTCEDLPKAWPWINVPLEVGAELCPVNGSWAEKAKIKMP